MIRPFSKLILTCLAGAMLSSCTDARQQYSETADPRVNGERQNRQEQELPDVQSTLVTCDIQCEIKQRSQKPMIYATGAAGLTFDMDLQTAQSHLYAPIYGPDEDGWAVYEESLQVLWGSGDKRFPVFIVATNSYLGPLNLPEPYGAIHMKDEQKQHFPAGDPLGHQFIVDLYNHFEDKDSSFNCIKSKDCKVILEDDAIQFDLPGLLIAFTKDERKALYYVGISENRDPGALGQSFDLINARTVIPKKVPTLMGQTISGEDYLPLGLAWTDVKDSAKAANTKTEVDRKYFSKAFNGVTAFISKSEYSRNYTEPNSDEVYEGIALYAPYNQNILMNGHPIWLTLSPNDVVKVIRSKTAPDVPEGTKVAPLQPTIPKMADKPQLQAEVMMQLKQILEEEMNAKYPQGLAYTTISGHLDNRPGRSIQVVSVGFDPSTNTGHSVFIRVNEKSGGLTFVVSLINDNFAPISIPAQLQDFDSTERGVAGYKLGDKVVITDLDIGRQEASLTATDNGGLKERVSFEEEVSVKVLQNVEGQIRDMRAVLSVVEGFSSVRLGLTAEDSSDANGDFRIRMITFPIKGLIKNLCHLPNFTVQYGDFDKTVQQRLISAVEHANQIHDIIQTKQKARDKNKSEGLPLDPANDLSAEEQKFANYKKCSYSTTLKNDGTGLFESISFPDQGLRLDFEMRTLNSVTIYPKSWNSQSLMNNGEVEQ